MQLLHGLAGPLALACILKPPPRPCLPVTADPALHSTRQPLLPRSSAAQHPVDLAKVLEECFEQLLAIGKIGHLWWGAVNRRRERSAMASAGGQWS